MNYSTIMMAGLGFGIGVLSFLSFGWAGPIVLAVGIILISRFGVMRSAFNLTLVIAGAILVGAFITESMGWT